MSINQQAPEPRDHCDTLELHSLFYTIQGEGPYCGHPAVFVRLAGCNLQCPGCDTEYTQGRERTTAWDIASRVIEAIGDNKCSLVVITGGEPFRQNITPLCILLNDAGFDIQIESNGSMPPPRDFPGYVTLVCSPKTHKIHPKTAERADCFKYVMRAGDVNLMDGLPITALDNVATPFVARPPAGYSGNIYLQPMDCKDDNVNKANIKAVLDSAMQHGYIVQLQIHKYLGVE